MTLSTRHPLIARRPPVLSGVIGIAVAIVVYLLVLLADKTLWTLEATKQDIGNPTYTVEVNKRTKDRGTVASILQALAFAAAVNSSLDKVSTCTRNRL